MNSVPQHDEKDGDTKTLRCSIYTRKSTDEGLDQDFNSLDAQREAAEAYIASQKHNGWVCLPTRYDDGGFSGGNTDRPALQRLLEDIKAGQIDCVLIYKIDRLSRSLLDFAQLMELFDRYNVSLTAITQHLVTTSSIGRLTLNILLSFAQFERELIAERTRDKMSAARRKGKWIGGYPVLGYDVDQSTKKLATNEDEALQVRSIFQLYLESGSLLSVAKTLSNRNWSTKRWTTKKGKQRGGKEYGKTVLHRMLTNAIYTGKVCYKNEMYEGEHDRIIDDDTWQQTQKLLRRNGRGGGEEARNKHGAILRGLIRCEPCGCTMTHSLVRKQGKKYRYYVCQTAQKRGWSACPTKSINAHEIENAVVNQIRGIGEDEEVLQGVIVRAKEQVKRKRADLQSEGLAIRNKLNGLHVKIQELTSELGNADAYDSSTTDRLADLHDQVRLLEQRAKEVKGELSAVGDDLVESKEMKHALTSFTPIWDSLSYAEQARILKLLIEKVRLDGRTDNVTIDFRYYGIKMASREAAIHG